ncbi:MAG: hypothetical protein SGPRY_011527, partial [Prymnesium sp.]
PSGAVEVLEVKVEAGQKAGSQLLLTARDGRCPPHALTHLRGLPHHNETRSPPVRSRGDPSRNPSMNQPISPSPAHPLTTSHPSRPKHQGPVASPSAPHRSKDGQNGSRRVLFTTDRTGAPLDSYGGSPGAVMEGRQFVGSSGSAPPGPSGASMAEVRMASGNGRHPSPESACASAAIKAAERHSCSDENLDTMQGERLLNLKDLARVVSTPENGMSNTPLHTSRASSVRSGGSAPVGSVMPSRKASSLLAASSARPVADAQAVQHVAGSPSSRADPTQSNQSTPKRYTEAQKVSPTNATKPAVAKPSTVMKRTASVSTQTPQSDKPDGEDGAGGEKGGGMADRDADSERLALVALEGRAATTLQAWLKGMLGRLKPQIVPGVRVELVLSGVEGVHAGVCRWRGALPQAKKSRSAWLGVELDEPVGRGDGSLPAGHSPSPSVRRYFQCEEGHAAFVATSRCRLENEDFDFDFELDESDDASLDFSIASDATAAVQESQR